MRQKSKIKMTFYNQLQIYLVIHNLSTAIRA